MMSNLFPFLYGIIVILLLWQAIRVMFRGNLFPQEQIGLDPVPSPTKGDRTGRLTIHPELLDQEGRITDEDLLTVRFSEEIDPSQSAETSAE